MIVMVLHSFGRGPVILLLYRILRREMSAARKRRENKGYGTET
jgi:hypothetical protein